MSSYYVLLLVVKTNALRANGGPMRAFKTLNNTKCSHRGHQQWVQKIHFAMKYPVVQTMYSSALLPHVEYTIFGSIFRKKASGGQNQHHLTLINQCQPCRLVQGPLITDGQNSNAMLILPTNIIQAILGISEVMKI